MKRYGAVVHCDNCDADVDVTVCEHLGATDLIPDECPNCDEPWPYEILEEAEIYA